MVCKYLPTEAPSPEALYRILCNGNMLGTASNVQRVPNIFPWGHHCKWVWCFSRFLSGQDTPCDLPHQSRHPAVTTLLKLPLFGEGPGFGLPKRKRLKAQGKNNKRKLILSLCLAPYTLYLKPLLLAKPLNSAPRKAGFSILNKSGGSWVEYQSNDGYISQLLLKQTRAQSKAVK